eukprot:Gb_41325 [translate_table: standard]
MIDSTGFTPTVSYSAIVMAYPVSNAGLTPPLPSYSSAQHQTCYVLTSHQHTHLIFFVDAAPVHRATCAATLVKSKRQSQANTISALCRETRLKYQLSIPLDSKSYASLLEACTNVKQLKQVHTCMLRSGLEPNIFLATKLVNTYTMWGDMDNARQVFDKCGKPNVFLWNAIIKGYAKNGPYQEALMLYYQMRWVGILPDNFTFPFVLKACAGLSALQEGKEIHNHIVRTGFQSDVYAAAALVDMYAKCGNIEFARHVFDKMSTRDLVSWNAMIAGCVQNERDNDSLMFFQQMQLAGIPPDSVTLVSALTACAHLAALQQGKWIHACILRSGFESDVIVATGLVDMYAKCGKIEIARQLFDKMHKRDVVSWDAMIAGYVQNGHVTDALAIFQRMQLAGIKPNAVTMVSLLPACAHLGALQQSKCIHGYIIRRGFELDVFVETALLDMYAKCGSIEIARQLFDTMSNKSVVSWSAMIAGYGMHGHGQDALALFKQMQETGMKPNDVTFIGVLSACSHAGLVDEGWRYFESMSQEYCIAPRVQHYACMVDLLGRAGLLDEAQDFIKKMPVEPSAGVWGSLLGACRIHCNIELGERVAERLFELEPEHAGYYVLLSNIYAAAGRWDDVTKVRTMMKDLGLKKPPGCSLIEINNKIHAFYVGDRSHPQSEKIYAMLENLAGQMKEAGYVPNMNFVLHDVEEEVKENLLYSHSEKLAIAFGLLNTSTGTPIRIMKNLRMCGDCHNASKVISKIARREIILRDANRFHHFNDGSCSCGDYW